MNLYAKRNIKILLYEITNMDILKKNIDELNSRLNNEVSLPESDDNLRILLVSTHIKQVTGYSKVAYNLVKQIASMPNVKLIHYGFQRSQVHTDREYPDNVESIDASEIEKQNSLSEGGFCFSGLPTVIKSRKPHIIIIYNDLSIVTQYLEAIRKSEIERTFKVWIYADQIYPIQHQQYLDIINRDADRVFAFSEYWRLVLKKQGIHRPISIINHGFESNDFPVLSKAEVRKQLNLPENAFIFMSLNRNQPRKRLDLLIMAFANLIVKHPQMPIFLIMVCDKGEKGGWNLFDIYLREVKALGGIMDVLSNRLLITSKDMSYTDSDVVRLYNVADVGVSCAEGEGWGLCSFEMMGIGKPQVVSDVGGHKEFCNPENSQVVPIISRYYLPKCYCSLGGEACVIDPVAFSIAMEKYALDSELCLRHGEAARAKVLEYSWEKVCGQLKKCIVREIEDIRDGISE
jgi:glycosyltransferase involved in cell wall biosynthesis